jgi:hypothetical protein
MLSTGYLSPLTTGLLWQIEGARVILSSKVSAFINIVEIVGF